MMMILLYDRATVVKFALLIPSRARKIVLGTKWCSCCCYFWVPPLINARWKVQKSHANVTFHGNSQQIRKYRFVSDCATVQLTTKWNAQQIMSSKNDWKKENTIVIVLVKYNAKRYKGLKLTKSNNFFIQMLQITDSTKRNRPGQKVFGKTPIEVSGPHLYASFGTFYAKIGQFFEAR